MSFVSRTREFLRRHVGAGLAAELQIYAGEAQALELGASALGQARASLAREQQLLQRWLERRSQPFGPDMTVHEAWMRHPGVRAVFLRHHLPACPACAVGADETLAEAAFGHRLDLEDLLQELNTLLKS